MIPLHIESKNGHDTEQVPDGKIQERVEQELKDDKWITLENKDGTSEILTKDDIPGGKPDNEIDVNNSDDWKDTFSAPKDKAKVATSSTTKARKKTWKDKFKSIRSATATHKAKGG